MNNVKDPRKAQELAVQMLPLADAWQADIIAPVCTNDDFKALLVALGKAITCTDALDLIYFLAGTPSATNDRKARLDTILERRSYWEYLDSNAVAKDHDEQASIPIGAKKPSALNALRELAGNAAIGAPGKPLNLDEVKSKPIDWLIPNLIPRGELVVLGADGGTGKGLYYAQLLANLTTGKGNDFFPIDLPTAGRVLIFSGEDEPSTIYKPRLLAAGADCSKIAILTADSYFRDTGKLLNLNDADTESFIRQAAPDLIVIDPYQSFLDAHVNMSQRNEMRAAITPFRKFCRNNNAAGLIVCHTNKKSAVAGRQRLADSADLWDLARLVIMLGWSKADEAVYASVEKISYSKRPMSTLFSIEAAEAEDVKTAVAVYRGRTDRRDADFILQRAATPTPTRDAVRDAILAALEDSTLGSMASTELQKSVLLETGCSEATYQRAYKQLTDEGLILKKPLHTAGKKGVSSWFTYLAACCSSSTL